MADLTSAFNQPVACYNGVHPTAYVDPSATIHSTAHIDPFVFIGAGVVVEENAVIHSHVSIEQGARIGAGSDIRSGVRITRNVKVGKYALLHENCVIGGDGFSFVTPDVGSAETAKQEGVVRADARNVEILKIYSLGAVTLGDYVEVGACTSIDRGTLADTIIGNGTKIDSSVQIGHNVKIGENCMVCGHVGIAGSAIIGDRCILAGKVGVADHVEIKHDSVIGAASNVATNVPAHSVMFGTPAIPKKDAIESIMGLRRLPRLIKALDELRDKVSLLEKK
jgi:UDP-3-O-[3-hydroxymyristoyl] glucosamine N-acyltransferase